MPKSNSPIKISRKLDSKKLFHEKLICRLFTFKVDFMFHIDLKVAQRREENLLVNFLLLERILIKFGGGKEIKFSLDLHLQLFFLIFFDLFYPFCVPISFLPKQEMFFLSSYLNLQFLVPQKNEKVKANKKRRKNQDKIFQGKANSLHNKSDLCIFLIFWCLYYIGFGWHNKQKRGSIV